MTIRAIESNLPTDAHAGSARLCGRRPASHVTATARRPTDESVPGSGSARDAIANGGAVQYRRNMALDRWTRPLAAAGAVLCAYRFLVRPKLVRWGATDDEVTAPFPGADIVPDGRRTATMAVTLDAPPSDVWPWLVQMGCDRAGWYSWDRLDNAGRRSADQIHGDWQQIAVGDRRPSSPDGEYWFEVAALESERFLALRAPLNLARAGRPFDPAGPRPRIYSDSTWCFLLAELPGQKTRLVVSGYAASRPRLLTRAIDSLIWEPAHWIMQSRQFGNLRRRVETGQT
jgi:hypothetical protein